MLGNITKRKKKKKVRFVNTQLPHLIDHNEIRTKIKD